jgi:hypothetical protein
MGEDLQARLKSIGSSRQLTTANRWNSLPPPAWPGRRWQITVLAEQYSRMNNRRFAI